MNRFLTSLIAFLSIAGVKAQVPMDIPKLVVFITIDQLRGDYLQYFAPTFNERGFKRFFNEGLYYTHIQYDFPNVGQAASIATLFTGTTPNYHGIVSDKKYDFNEHREVSIIRDPAFLGNYTSENISPLSLLSSTIGDELKNASGGQSDVYSIAPCATEAVLSGGRLANTAFWIEDYNGKWATSTYYSAVPWYVDRYNMKEGISNSSVDYTWAPSSKQYNPFPYNKTLTPFKYTFSRNDKERFKKIKTSPLINTEVTALAGKFFEYADLGKRATPDMLNITYYAGNYVESSTDEYSLELQDIYCRLDKEIENLLALIDKNIGIHNSLIVLTSTGYFDSHRNSMWSVPYGEFHPSRCTALLNMYLMALYGEGQWVKGYYNQQIYLNKKLAEDKKIEFAEILIKSAAFISEFSGVQDVTIASTILFDSREGGNTLFRKGIHKNISGDLFLELQPGWIEINEQQADLSKNIRNNAIIAPLFFLGHRVPHQKVSRLVKATSIAPTVTHVLRIRPPNASTDLPLQEFLNF